MTLIKSNNINGPATHALVIGVGSYTHLIGGTGTLFPEHGGMGQLFSPPHSARAFADWLLKDYNNPSKPLASIEMLISDSQTQDYSLPTGEAKQIEKATMANVEAAINNWFDRGDQEKDNLLIFYFCGHGLARGLLTALLLENFGERAQSPLKQAINLDALHLGMDKCKARYQCYFIDACRIASSTLIQADGYYGDPIIPGSALHSQVGVRKAPVFYSTLAGTQAFGIPGKPSVYTGVLLSALRGPGSNDFSGDWCIDTDTLNTGIRLLLEREISRYGDVDQLSSVNNLANFTLHYLKALPEALVEVSCKPEHATQDASLSCSNGTKTIQRDAPDSSPWNIMLETGNYDFHAKFTSQQFKNNSRSDYVRPPFKPVKIEVLP